jgi:regulator of sigma E protease
MQALQTFLAYLLTIGVLITVHEYGHYRAAVACGVRVFRFSLGFGRVVWSRRFGKDGCEFALSLLPLGGYVRMLEQVDADTPAQDRPRALESRPLWQRMVVVAAGPGANFLLAMALFAGAQWIGVQKVAPVLGTPPAGSLLAAAGAQAQDRVLAAAEGSSADADADDDDWRSVRSEDELYEAVAVAMMDGRALRLQLRRPDEAGARTLTLPLESLGRTELDAATLARVGLGPPYMRPVIGRLAPDGPGARAGLRAGDLVLAIDGEPVADRDALLQRVRASGADGRPRALRMQVRRGGDVLALEVTPRAMEEGGQRFGRIDAEVGEPPAEELVRDGFLDSLRFGAVQTWRRCGLQLRVFAHMARGQLSARNLSGPISIADAAKQSIRHGFADFLLFLAEISVSLGVVNLLPLPVLDGGRLLYYLFEGATGRAVSALWQTRLQIGGVLAILLLMSLALSNDVARHLGQQ